MFRKPNLIDVLNRDIDDAKAAAHDHAKAAEHHSALATMYAGRVARLGAQLADLTKVLEKPKSPSALDLIEEVDRQIRTNSTGPTAWGSSIEAFPSAGARP